MAEDIVKSKITTPKGELRYVQVSGLGKLDYDGKFYEYNASIVLNKKDAKKLYGEICEFFEEEKPIWFRGKEPTNKIKRETEEGDFIFHFKTKTEFEDDKGNVRHTKIGIINFKNKAVNLPSDEAIGNGSIGRISGTMTIFSDKRGGSAGVSLWLNNIQLLKYVKYVPDTGFDEEDEGDELDFDNTPDAEGAKDFNEPKKKKKKKKKKIKDVE